MLKDLTFQQKKKKRFWLTKSIVMLVRSEQEIAADNGM